MSLSRLRLTAVSKLASQHALKSGYGFYAALRRFTSAQTEAENLAKSILNNQKAKTAQLSNIAAPSSTDFPDTISPLRPSSSPDVGSSPKSTGDTNGPNTEHSTVGDLSASVAEQHRMHLLLTQLKISQTELELIRLREASLLKRVQETESKGRKRDLLLVVTGVVLMLQGLWISSEFQKRQSAVELAKTTAVESKKDMDNLMEKVKSSLAIIAVALKNPSESDKQVLAKQELQDLKALYEQIHTRQVKSELLAPK